METKTWFNHEPLLAAHNKRTGKAADIAKRVGISRAHYYDLISGKESPPLSTAKRLCAALGVEVASVVDLAAL